MRIDGAARARSVAVLAERLYPQSRLFGAQIVKSSASANDAVQEQSIRKNLVQAKEAPGAHLEILDGYLKDPALSRTESERIAVLLRWLTRPEKEKALPDRLHRFDTLYLRLRQAASNRQDRLRYRTLMPPLEKEILAFARDQAQFPWAQSLAGLARQLSEVTGERSSIEKDKEFYFDEGSRTAVDDAPFHYLLGQLYLGYFDRADVSKFLKLIATEFEKCLLICGSNASKELWAEITAIYVGVHNEYLKKKVPVPFWFEELVYKRIIKFEPTNPSAHNNLSSLYSNSGINLEEALKEARIANQISPNNPYFLDTLGWAFYKNGQLDQALETMQKSVALKADIADARFHLASVYFDKNELVSASKEFKETIRLDPGHFYAKNNLAYLYAGQGERLEEAMLLVDQALSGKPDSGAFLDTKGWIYYKQKRYDQAIVTLKRAIELRPEEPDLHMHLGTVLLTLGRRQEADLHFQEAKMLGSSTRSGSPK